MHIHCHHYKFYCLILEINFSGETKKEGDIVGQYTRPAELTEEYMITSSAVKPLVIHHLIKLFNWKKTIIFTNSREATHRLSFLLQCLSQEDYNVAEFSSDKGPQRAQIVSQFSSGKIDV